MSISIGFDIGGTFTDFAMFDRKTGRWFFTKIRTTPDDRAAACVEGVEALLSEAGEPSKNVSYVAHGSTVATNTIIERKGAKTALITTRGFRDVLEIRRQIMPDRYDLRVRKPQPLVRRPLRFEVSERVMAGGAVEQDLNETEFRALLHELEAQGIESIAICFLHSYANPVNEDKAMGIALAREGWYVCASHAVLNEFREYERTSTAVANAYVAPTMQRYLHRLEHELAERIGVKAPLLIFQSNGGVVPAKQAGTLPIASVMSGPAAGVMGASAVAQQDRLQDFISLDMGGTSCDVSLIKDSQPTFTFEREIDGWPVRTPRLDIHSVGAGGGSIAWVDVGQLLRVGPQSAGANPGPACYGRGGQDATVADANVILGRLNPKHLLAGRMVLDRGAAEKAVGSIGKKVGLNTVQAAAGIVDVVNSTMVRAIRVVSVERGYDPQEFALVPFGGAGPLHACDLAREMSMSKIVVPPFPGLLCALGLLVSDLRVDGSLTRWVRLQETSVAELKGLLDQVETDLRNGVAVHNLPDAGWHPAYQLDMRYQGQSFELRVPLTAEHLEEGGLQELATAFDEVHNRVYGFATPRVGKEIVCFRVLLRAPSGLQAGQMPRHVHSDGNAAPQSRPVFFRGVGWVDGCPVYRRDQLAPGHKVEGPAVIEQMDTTTIVTPDFLAEVDQHTNLVLTPR